MDTITDIKDKHHKSLFQTQPSPVAIITLTFREEPVGFTAASVLSASVGPSVILFTVMNRSSSLPALLEAKSVVIHFLDAGQQDLAKRFATSGIDRFKGVEWSALHSGEPLLAGIDTWARCELTGIKDIGSSKVVYTRPEQLMFSEQRRPLLYMKSQYYGVGSVLGSAEMNIPRSLYE